MYQKSRGSLALVLFLCVGCPRTSINVGDVPDGAVGGAGGGGAGAGGGTAATAPPREVDILFLVDNSPSMDPKQQALAANFPAMINVLQSLPGGLPDVHIGVVSSDMGAGSGELGGNCSRILGDKGILWGNDPTAGAIATVAGGTTNGCGLNVGARFIKDVRNANGVGRDKNYTGNLTDVFSCLAKAVGVGGCGMEHQLQALRVALYPQKDINDVQNKDFLRPEAYLAIVIITDEDDCSAVPSSDVITLPNNGGIFISKMSGETASLRCAARGHVCNGQAIPNYDTTNGYTGAGFAANFADCAAKEFKGNQQQYPNSRDYNWLPLLSVQDMIDTVNSVKAKPQEQILVSGIIGWPQNGDLTNVQYQIGKDSTSLPPQNNLWDYMPICSLPNIRSGDGNIYKAYGGLRLKKFIDAYGANGQTYSICNNDFTPAMTQIGSAIAKKLKFGCVNYPLVDTNPDLPEIQPDCMVTDEQTCSPPGQGDCLPTGYREYSLLECIDPSTGNPLSPSNPNLNSIPDDEVHRPCWYLVYDKDPNTGCPDAPWNQRISALRRTGTTAPAGTLLKLDCRTCQSSGDPRCAH